MNALTSERLMLALNDLIGAEIRVNIADAPSGWAMDAVAPSPRRIMSWSSSTSTPALGRPGKPDLTTQKRRRRTLGPHRSGPTSSDAPEPDWTKARAG